MVLIPVADDEVATIVTTLEMRTRPPLRPMPVTPLRLVHWQTPTLEAYRRLFTRIGAPWLWFSRLAMDEARLVETLAEPARRIFAVADPRGIEVGLLELDSPGGDVVDIAYFALVPELAGKGHGRWLMAQAMALAWAPGVACIRVRTCTLDHPSALSFYRAQGFVATARTIETFPDPRALGLLPADAASQIPYLASRR
ncbi:GNAT family N-acetyltransferase [uncultured Sphingomonas sp.]|uniref:GNAT family N-acetyltransferase n=1 Tax=uncultured Sphingomonas sp. TaxID=158754 RepID=UPI0035CC9446